MPLLEQLVSALTEKDEGVNLPLFRPFVLGTGFLAVGMDMPNQTNVGMLTAIMETDLGLPMSLLEEHAAAVPEIAGDVSIDDVMSPALAFLRDLLDPLDPEPDTCFVAMPFSEPFEERYATVYRPMMSGVGYRTLRAWGGLSSEAHHELLLTLIDKSGALLAELAGVNPNVAFELGYAYGRGKRAIPDARQRASAPARQRPRARGPALRLDPRRLARRPVARRRRRLCPPGLRSVVA